MLLKYSELGPFSENKIINLKGFRKAVQATIKRSQAQRIVMQLHITHTQRGRALETTLSELNNCDCQQLVENTERLKRQEKNYG